MKTILTGALAALTLAGALIDLDAHSLSFRPAPPRGRRA